MSAPNPVDELQDELACPICLGPFKEPVILDCWHNFCHACITDYWKVSDTGVCPQCRKKSFPESELRPNKQLEKVVDIAKDLEGVCEKHGEFFSCFCKEDRILICKVCRESREHKGHRVIPIEAAAEEYKDQLVNHLNHFQHVREQQGRQQADKEEEYQTLLKQTQSQNEEIASAFKQVHQILKQREQLVCNRLEGLIQELAKTRNKNTNRYSDRLLLLDNLIAEINQKWQQPETECLKDIDGTLSRCEKLKDVEEVPVDSLSELVSRVQAVSESWKAVCDLLKNIRVSVESAPELDLESIPPGPSEGVPNSTEEDDTSHGLLDYEDGKCDSDRCEEKEVGPTEKQNNANDVINVEPEEVIDSSFRNCSVTLNLLDKGQVVHQSSGNWLNAKFRRYGGWKTIAAVTGLLAVVLIVVILGNPRSVSKTCVTPLVSPTICCPENWIGYQGKCYFFSEDEANWTSSQHFCSSHDATLVSLDTLKEKDFLMRYKGNLDPWIALRRDPDQPWKWPNGSIFDERFEIEEGVGECAYIYTMTVISSRCYIKRNWICSRPDEFAKRKIT